MRYRLLCLIAAITALAGATPAAAQLGFGRAVVVGDGEVIVGEPTSGNAFRPGAVYIYRKSGGQWRETAKLSSPDAQRADGFGAPLAISGSRLFVGQNNRIHVFERQSNGTWRAAGSLNANVTDGQNFGAAMAAAGDWLFVGAPARAQGGRRGGGGQQQNQQPGSVHTFRRDASGRWTEQARLTAPDASPGDAFGTSIALAGERALIGAPGQSERAGVVYTFALSAGSWTAAGSIQAREPQANEAFGTSVAFQGESVIVGTPGSAGGYGAAFVFHRSDTGNWVESARLAAFNGNRQEGFGSVLAADGADIWLGVSGAPETGAAYVFRAEGDSPSFSAARMVKGNETEKFDRFGTAVAMRGSVAAVAAAGADHGAGAVSVFERASNGEWRDSGRLESAADALDPLTGQERKCPTEGKVGLFACKDAELLAFIPVSRLSIDGRGVRLNDIWGWTDAESGREYALVGRIEATSFVDVTDPMNPIFLGELPKTPGVPDGTWRDIKVYKDHAFIVADGSGAHGMQVFDLRQLRRLRGNPPVSFEPTAHYTRINSSHNIVINEETGFAYAVGASAGGETCGGGLHMIDVRTPANPVFAGCFADPQTGRRGTGYSHDAQCVVYKGPDTRYTGREICLGSNENALSIADVTDKGNPRAISRAAYPNPAYSHQGWLTDDHKYFFMDDEGDEIARTVDRTRTIVWDLTDLEDPKLAHEFMGATSASDHNLYIKGNLMYQSNYRAGLRIIDISDPLRPVEVGYFDTAPYLEDAPGFSGTWSNYPYFKSGAIAVTSVHEGLFLVKKRPTTTVF